MGNRDLVHLVLQYANKKVKTRCRNVSRVCNEIVQDQLRDQEWQVRRMSAIRSMPMWLQNVAKVHLSIHVHPSHMNSCVPCPYTCVREMVLDVSMISSRRPPEVLLDQIFPLLEKLTVKYKSLKLLQTGSNVRHLRLEGDQAIGSLQGLSSLETLTAWNAETATEIMVEHAQTLQCIELVSLNPCDLRTISQTDQIT